MHRLISNFDIHLSNIHRRKIHIFHDLRKWSNQFSLIPYIAYSIFVSIYFLMKDTTTGINCSL